MKKENNLPLLWHKIYDDSNPKIIGIDPGESSGLVIFATDKEEIIHHCTLEKKNLFWLFEQLEQDNFHGIERNLEICKVHKIIIEEFKLYPWANMNFKEMEVVKIIGVLEYLIPAKFRTFQKPANKLFFKEPKLKKLGYNTAGMTEHEKDALKHILFYYHLVKNNTQKFLQLLDKEK